MFPAAGVYKVYVPGPGWGGGVWGGGEILGPELFWGRIFMVWSEIAAFLAPN